MTDEPTEDAIRALAHRAYDRDHTEPEERTSPTDFGFEFITWLKARGWSYTPPTTLRGASDTGLRGAAIARQALAQAASKKGTADDR